jgi:hypothetical protein
MLNDEMQALCQQFGHLMDGVVCGCCGEVCHA